MSAEAGSTDLEHHVGDALAHWVRASAKQRRLVFALCGVLFVAALVISLRDLGIQSDKNALFPKELPFRVLDARYFAAFPQLRENIVVLIEGETAASTRSAAHRLAATLEADPGHFGDVYLPADPFFERNGLLYLELDELVDIADRLARLQPLLAAVVRDPSLPGLIDPLRRALEALRRGEVDDLDLAPILDRLEATLGAAEEGRVQSLDWSEIVSWGDGSPNLLRQAIYVSPRLDFGSMAAAEGAIHALRRAAADLGIGGPEASLRLRMTGDMVLNFEEMQLLETQVSAAGVASLVVVVILLFAALRSTRLVTAIVVSLLFGLVCTAGFATLAIGHLNMISVAFAVLFIGLGVDFGIHLCMRFQELAGAGQDTDASLDEMARGVGSSLVLCAATTSIGFFAFVPTEFKGVAELGVIAGVGMFIGLVSSFTLIPAWLAGKELSPRAASANGARSPDASWPARYPRTIVAIAFGTALLALVEIPHIRFDSSPLGVRDPAAESVEVYAELVAEPGATPWTLNYLARTRAEAEHFAARFMTLPEVDDARTLFDYVPEAQAVKLAVIEEINLFADWTAIEPLAAVPTVGERRAAIDALRIELESGATSRLGPEVARAAAALQVRLARLASELDRSSSEDAERRLAHLEQRLLERFRDPIDRLERALAAEAFDVDALPIGLRRRMISDEGLIRVEILPKADLTNDRARDAFVASVRRISDQVAGPPVSIHDSAHAVVGALREAFTAALLVIVAILVLIWRRTSDVLFVLIPLVWAGLATGLGMVALGIDFNFADVIVLPLLLGIGVDSGIHMVHRLRIEGRESLSLLGTSTARAVVFSALTTIASFGSLALVPHRGMASLGQLLVLGVSSTVVANLVLLPALLTLATRSHR